MVKDGYAKVVYVDVHTGNASTTSDTLVYVIKENGFAVDDGTTCKELTVIKDGVVDASFLVNKGVSVTANTLYKITKNDGDNHPSEFAAATGSKYETVPAVDGKTGTFAYNDGTLVLTLNGIAHEFYTDAETAVYSITDDGFDSLTADSMDGLTTTKNVYLIYESDNNKTVAEIYFVEAD